MKYFLDSMKNILFLSLAPSILMAGNSAPIPSAMLRKARAEMVEVQNQNLSDPNNIDSPNKSSGSANKEALDEVDAPPPPPALIDLETNAPKSSTDISNIGQAGLILFNVIMFTTGIVLVKGTSGKKVH